MLVEGSRARAVGRQTVSRVESRLDAAGLADEDRGVRVVLLHGGVAALEEVPVHLVSLLHPYAHSPSPAPAHHNLLISLPGAHTVSQRCAR